MQAVGKAPKRWWGVYKSMRSHLKDIVFVGEIEVALDTNGVRYNKLTSISAQSGHEDKAQTVVANIAGALHN